MSCVGAEIVHITSDIRLSSILEKLRGASPVDPDDGEPSPSADPAQNSCEYEGTDSTFSVEIQLCIVQQRQQKVQFSAADVPQIHHHFHRATIQHPTYYVEIID